MVAGAPLRGDARGRRLLRRRPRRTRSRHARRAGGNGVAEAALATGATAVIAYNDLVAAGLLARWRDLEVRVPEQVSLVGVDNTSVTELFLPRLTSVGPDLRVLGETAIDLLLDRIEARGTAAGASANGATGDPDASKGDPETSADALTAIAAPRELPGVLEVRGSTGPAPVR
ncbi:LacI family transcriptional regulator [Agromyces protaetiae]|uniref:LacI family transcriptional regulator n=1 Tax=Agromyces protaetiae TaxID=2509455 RepID=A0A4P6F943_9MICO|nr:substrate-binding domain-containing protein [Agromyces protaetiae]QAY72294.1 LacI family transcriptional regulator [Agromyces protaetiae]